MKEEIIDGTRIEHNGDVNTGLEYLRNHWNDAYVLEKFENARTSADYQDSFTVNGVDGFYILKRLGDRHYSLRWSSR